MGTVFEIDLALRCLFLLWQVRLKLIMQRRRNKEGKRAAAPSILWTSINYVSIFERGGGHEILPKAYVGKGGVSECLCKHFENHNFKKFQIGIG